MFCTKCRNELSQAAVFCGSCGTQVGNFTTPIEKTLSQPTLTQRRQSTQKRSSARMEVIRRRQRKKLIAGSLAVLFMAIITAMIIPMLSSNNAEEYISVPSLPPNAISAPIDDTHQIPSAYPDDYATSVARPDDDSLYELMRTYSEYPIHELVGLWDSMDNSVQLFDNYELLIEWVEFFDNETVVIAGGSITSGCWIFHMHWRTTNDELLLAYDFDYDWGEAKYFSFRISENELVLQGSYVYGTFARKNVPRMDSYDNHPLLGTWSDGSNRWYFYSDGQAFLYGFVHNARWMARGDKLIVLRNNDDDAYLFDFSIRDSQLILDFHDGGTFFLMQSYG